MNKSTALVCVTKTYGGLRSKTERLKHKCIWPVLKFITGTFKRFRGKNTIVHIKALRLKHIIIEVLPLKEFYAHN